LSRLAFPHAIPVHTGKAEANIFASAGLCAFEEFGGERFTRTGSFPWTPSWVELELFLEWGTGVVPSGWAPEHSVIRLGHNRILCANSCRMLHRGVRPPTITELR
jgi:hypothetical protein